MRGGVVPFGQGMVFAIGGYAAALLYNKLGFTDALGLALAGGVMATLIAAPFAPLLSRYRGIFFAMLTLALSMVTYGLLMKIEVLGGSDGFNVGRPTLLAGAARRPGRLRAVPADRRRGHGDGAAGAHVLRFDARPGHAGGARERAARRVPRRLGAPGDDDQLPACGLLRRHRRRAGGDVARPHRAATSATGRPRASSSSSPSSPAGRAWPRCSWPAPCSRSCASFSSAYFPEHLAAGARPVPAVRDPLPAARHRLVVDQAGRAR